jgi:hypothetical protein
MNQKSTAELIGSTAALITMVCMALTALSLCYVVVKLLLCH